MILALDVGNTNIVLGVMKEGRILFQGRLCTDKSQTEMEYAILFKNILELHHISPEMIDGAIISSVVPPVNAILEEAIRFVTGCEAMLVNFKRNTGLIIDIDTPSQLGNDVIVDAVAALEEYPPPLIIFDLGTATTISVVNEEKVYIGGVILPGIKVSQEALSGRTSQLPSIGLEAPANVIGRNTVDCMKSGMLYGTAAMMDGMIDRIEEELGQKATAIATGGLAWFVAEHCKRPVICDDDLLLKGLWKVYQNEQKSKIEDI